MTEKKTLGQISEPSSSYPTSVLDLPREQNLEIM